MSQLERVLKTMLVFISWHSASVLVQHIHWRGYFGVAPTSYPALLLKALPHNVGIPSVVTLLPSCHSKGNLFLGVSVHLEKAAIISVWTVL